MPYRSGSARAGANATANDGASRSDPESLFRGTHKAPVTSHPFSTNICGMLLRFVGSVPMPMSVWIAVASALVLALCRYLWPDVPVTTETVRRGALIAAIGLAVLWVAGDFLRKVRSGWRRWSSRPYF
jgi:hypothetical protein